MAEIDTLWVDGAYEDLDKLLSRLDAHTRQALCLTPEFDFPYRATGANLLQALGDFSLVPANLRTTRLPAAGDAPPEASVRFSYSEHKTQPRAAARAIARWMGSTAESQGFPAELPVMAALTESAIRNLVDGDRDSAGYFQIRVGIHGASAVETPEAQLRWFLNAAQNTPNSKRGRKEGWTVDGLKQQIQTARTLNNQALLAYWLGAWCQDIERSAYPDRYEKNFSQAQKLLYSND